ncbi:MAG: aminotransferase class V-fold PLP-dependent enzyme [Chloroflexi bacterium]|nr:aminotransferase class V-fold PLP-dependent enzyme [Chloroflexota bacterium]
MNEWRSRPSRRMFLGGSLAAAGTLAMGPLASRADTRKSGPALPLSDLVPPRRLDEAFWRKVRSEFNLIEGLAFMNNGSLGPVWKAVQEENERVFRELPENPTNGGRRDELHANREKLAAFVGASKDEVAYSRSTTEGMNVFAHGIDWREGDEVLMCSHEHIG